MAEKAAPTEEEGAAERENFLDQFLRRLDQTSDQEAGVSPSTSGVGSGSGSPMASSTAPGGSANSTDYPSLSATNPWFMPTPHGPLSPLQSLLYSGSASVASPYSPQVNPLAEFPWLLQEFDHPRPPGLDSADAHDSAQILYSPYSPQEQILGAPSSQRDQFPGVKDEPAAAVRTDPIGHGGGSSSSPKLDAGRVPRFESTVSSDELRPSPAHFSESVQAQIIGARGAMNYRPPTSPLLSEATGTTAMGGSVTTSAGTSNTSVSSESTSNAGDKDESETKEGETSSGTKRKKPEAAAAAGGTGEEGTSTGGATESSKKSDPPKHKPRKRGGAKRSREPRYAIKTRTDVDVLDDGFKWRKYGQKAVKNSPHPRNYYRCTTPLCPVRKRVERSNEDSGLVITTYEGTHTHQTPGFHRPSAGLGYFGDRPLGMGGGLFQSPLGPGGANLLPLPPGFDLASLQQANLLRSIRGLQPNPSQFPSPLRPDMRFQQQAESLLRAQQFLGLPTDPSASPFGSVKQEPFQFNALAAETFMSRNLSSPQIPNRLFQDQPAANAAGPSSMTRSISDHALQQQQQPRPGTNSPLFTGLPAFPGVTISGPASSSSNISPREPDTSTLHRRLENILPAGVGSCSSSRDDQGLETLVSSSSGRQNFDQAQGGSEQPQPGRSMSSSQTIILGSGGPDPLPAGGQQPQHQPGHQPGHQPQRHHQPGHQQQHQQGIRSAGAGGLGSSSESFKAQGSESSIGQQAAEGLLQDMVRPGVPKVSNS